MGIVKTECQKRERVIMRCLAHYTNYLLEKQKENKKRGYPSIIDEDIEKKIEGLNALKETWNRPSEDRIDKRYFKLFSDSLINYRQELLKSIESSTGRCARSKRPLS